MNWICIICNVEYGKYSPCACGECYTPSWITGDEEE